MPMPIDAPVESPLDDFIWVCAFDDPDALLVVGEPEDDVPPDFPVLVPVVVDVAAALAGPLDDGDEDEDEGDACKICQRDVVDIARFGVQKSLQNNQHH